MLSQRLRQGVATYFLSEEGRIVLPEPLRIQPYRWVERNPPPFEQIKAMLDSLEEYLGKDSFYWLCACAVFPELHWNITIYLGNVLRTELGQSLIEVCSLTDLARLPWLRYGYMPDWLRVSLITTFTEEQQQIIRAALQDLLITAVQGSVSKLQLEVARQYHSFLPKLANPILYLLSKQAPEASQLRDYIFLKFMTEQPVLGMRVSDEFNQSLKKQKRDDWLRKVLRKLGIVVKPPIQNFPQSKKKVKLWLLIGLVGMVASGSVWYFVNKKVNSDLSSVTTPEGTWLYGGSASWASIRQYVDPKIKKAHPQFELRYTDAINATPGSGTGIRLLLEGQLSFSQSSRPIADREYQQALQRGLSLKQIPVALEGLAIVVHPDLQIPGLTLGQIKDIYTGKITNWNQVGGPDLKITAYSRRFDDGGTVEFLVDNILGKEKLGSNVVYVQDTTDGLRKLASDRSGIYYALPSEVVPQCGIKTLPIAKQGNSFVAPYIEPLIKPEQCPNQRNKLNIDAFKTGQYPITRQMFVIVKQNNSGSLEQQAGEAYANMLLTTQGQKLMNEIGFIGIR